MAEKGKVTGSKAKKGQAVKKAGAANTKKSVKEKILVPIDATKASIKAIDYLVKLGGVLKSCELMLCHVLPTIPPKMLEDGGSEDPEIERDLKADRDEEIGEWEGELRTRTMKIFKEYKKKLVESGIPSGNISTKLIERTLDVGKAIVNIAQEEGFSTIVVGRRGVSFIQELALGSVSYRVVKLAKGCTVWVVH
jgi:nucleotide-binding universal stress UspA family protein